MTDSSDLHLSLRHGDPPAVVRNGNADPFGGIRVPEQYAPLVIKAAQAHSVPPAYLAWLLKQESGFNPRAVGINTSSGRAQGMAQFMPATAKQYGVDPFDPESAIPGAARYLASLASKHGNWEQALARYGTFSTGRGAAADAVVRQRFRQFAQTGRFGDELPVSSGLEAGHSGGSSTETRVPYYPDPEDLVDPVESLWNAYAQDDNLTRILRGVSRGIG